MVLGSLMGDGSLSPNRRDRQRRPVPAADTAPSRSSTWTGRSALLGNIKHSTQSTTPAARCSSTSRRCPSSHELQRAVYLGDGKKLLTEEYLKALTPLALAIWYMDDGAFTVRSKGLQAAHRRAAAAASRSASRR